jgi:hypothetical protein
MGIDGCLMSIHEPAEAASWIEENWDNPFFASIQNSGCGGPFACMLSPTEPALAIFGCYDNPVVVNTAESLAGLSGFPVLIRPLSDNPALNLLCVKLFCSVGFNTYAGNSPRSCDVAPQSAPVQIGDTAGNNDQRSSDNDDGDEAMVDERTPGNSGDGGRRNNDRDNAGNDVPGLNTADDQARRGFVMGMAGGGGGGDGGGDGGPTKMDGKWKSQLHTTRVKLRLKLSNAHTYAVTIAYDFKVGPISNCFLKNFS